MKNVVHLAINKKLVQPLLWVLFLCLLAFSSDKKNSVTVRVNGFHAILYISLNDTTETPEDSISLSNNDLSKLLSDLRMKSVQKAGYCDNLCGTTGMFLKVSQCDSSLLDSLSNFIIDYGYGCQKTGEACITLGDFQRAPCIAFDYGQYTHNFLNHAWAGAKRKKQ
jgi:hypothetical protein